MKESQTIIKFTMYMYAWLLWEKAICGNSPNVLTTKFSKDLCLECSTCAMFFKVVVDGFSKQWSVLDAHHCPFHVALEFGHQLDAVYKQTLKQFKKVAEIIS